MMHLTMLVLTPSIFHFCFFLQPLAARVQARHIRCIVVTSHDVLTIVVTSLLGTMFASNVMGRPKHRAQINAFKCDSTPGTPYAE